MNTNYEYKETYYVEETMTVPALSWRRLCQRVSFEEAKAVYERALSAGLNVSLNKHFV